MDFATTIAMEKDPKNEDNVTQHAPPPCQSSPISTAVFLPTKVYSNPSDGASHQAYPEGPVHWTNTTVVQWVESLAMATERSEILTARAQGLGTLNTNTAQPLSINSTILSNSTDEPANAPWACRPEYRNDYGNNVNFRDHTTGAMPTNMPKEWNMSNVESQDPWAWIHTGGILALAVELEQIMEQDNSPTNSRLYHEYRQLPTRLEFLVGRILGQFPHGTAVEHGEIRRLLDSLYQDNIFKLKRMIQEAHDLKNMTTIHPPKQTTKELAPFMNTWLKENWTNPYPDEKGLEDMARECGTTAVVVSNWLINARTRKWRRSINRALALNRPVNCLLEDSLRFFEGERSLNERSGRDGTEKPPTKRVKRDSHQSSWY